jgi:hypothetical protein
MNKLSPLQMVKEQFETKENLVNKVVELLAKGKDEKDELKEKLLVSTNKKLIRLFNVGTEIKNDFGSKEKLIEKILSLKDKIKDTPYKEKISKFSLPRLLDMAKSIQKKN